MLEIDNFVKNYRRWKNLGELALWALAASQNMVDFPIFGELKQVWEIITRLSLT